MTAIRDGGDYILNGEKTWISNGGIADLYVVFARTGEGPGARGISAFRRAARPVRAVNRRTPRGDRAASARAHQIRERARSRCRDDRCARRGLSNRNGDTRHIPQRRSVRQRSGFARRALDETVARARGAQAVRSTAVSDLQMVQASIAEMALDIDAAALLVYRAAWTKDIGAERVTREAAMAKLFATERAQDVIDKAVQVHGGDGVRRGHIVESLYREIRALRIYEGASEVQKVVIARQTLAGG